jgi:hypothetical protein
MSEHDGDLGAFIGILEGDLQAVAEVLATRRAAAP